MRMIHVRTIMVLAALALAAGCAHPRPPHQKPPRPAAVRPAPVVVETNPAADQAAPETATVLISNPNGSQTPVTLTKVGPKQWRGPNGELYYGIPSEAQLRPAYGLK